MNIDDGTRTARTDGSLCECPDEKAEDDDGLCPHGFPPEFCGNCHEEADDD